MQPVQGMLSICRYKLPASSMVARSSSVSIPASVNKIEDMAFYGCKALKSVRYGGTQEAWSRIAVGSMNYSLNAASVTCADTGK